MHLRLTPTVVLIAEYQPEAVGNALAIGIVSQIAPAIRSEINAYQDASRKHIDPSAKLLLTLAEAQALTGLSRGVLREAIDKGKLKGQVIGRAWRIKRTDLEAYIKKL